MIFFLSFILFPHHSCGRTCKAVLPFLHLNLFLVKEWGQGIDANRKMRELEAESRRE